MGKAFILQNIGEGQYVVNILLNKDVTNRRLELIAETLDNLNQQLLLEYYQKGDAYKLTELKIAALEKEKEKLESTPSEIQETVWCADFSEELSGEVGTIETHGTQGGGPFEKVLIKPGYNEGSVYDRKEDGQLMDMSLEMDPWQWYWNWCALPGWQKFAPLYRVGTITAIDNNNNSAHVQLDNAISAAQGLSITKPGFEILYNIPVKYMQCNSLAFDVSDRVIVKFKDQTWEGDKEIVGFAEEPQPCPVYLRVKVNGTVCSWYAGGKKVRVVQKPEGSSEWVQVGETQVVDHTTGVAGPFEGLDLSKPFRAQLYYQSNAYVGGAPAYWFQYFEEGTEADHDINLGFFVAEGTTDYWGVDVKRFAAFVDRDKITSTNPDSVEEKNWYLKRLEWNTSDEGNIQATDKKVKVNIGGEEGTVYCYDVDFQCKVIRYRHTGWTYEGSVFNLYMACRTRGDIPRIYTLPDTPTMVDEDGWGYTAMFCGDKKNGNWTYDPFGYSQGHPQAGYTAVNNLFDAWGAPPYDWVAAGQWFLNLADAANLWNCDTKPIILTSYDGSIVYEPPAIIFRINNVERFNAGGCILDDDDFCIEGTGINPCGGDYKYFNQERHVYTYEPVDLPEAFI